MTPDQPTQRKLRMGFLSAPLLGMSLLGGLGYFFLNPTDSSQEKTDLQRSAPPVRTLVSQDNTPSGQPVSKSESSADSVLDLNNSTDEQIEERLVGKWTQTNSGKRVLHLNQDGSALLFYYPDGKFRRKLYGEQLTLNMTWSVKDKRIQMVSLGGEPKTKIKLVLKIFGRERSHRIVSVSKERVILMDVDDEEQEPPWTVVSE